MSDNTDNPAFPIIEYLKERISDCDTWYNVWKENHQYPPSINKMATYRDRKNAFCEVLKFINENFNENGK